MNSRKANTINFGRVQIIEKTEDFVFCLNSTNTLIDVPYSDFIQTLRPPEPKVSVFEDEGEVTVAIPKRMYVTELVRQKEKFKNLIVDQWENETNWVLLLKGKNHVK